MLALMYALIEPFILYFFQMKYYLSDLQFKENFKKEKSIFIDNLYNSSME